MSCVLLWAFACGWLFKTLTLYYWTYKIPFNYYKYSTYSWLCLIISISFLWSDGDITLALSCMCAVSELLICLWVRRSTNWRWRDYEEIGRSQRLSRYRCETELHRSIARALWQGPQRDTGKVNCFNLLIIWSFLVHHWRKNMQNV